MRQDNSFLSLDAKIDFLQRKLIVNNKLKVEKC